MDDGLNSAWLGIWMLLSPLFIVFVFGLILTSPLWIFLIASQLFRGGVMLRNKIEKRKKWKEGESFFPDEQPKK